jgi:hypothetical protein
MLSSQSDSLIATFNVKNENYYPFQASMRFNNKTNKQNARVHTWLKLMNYVKRKEEMIKEDKAIKREGDQEASH